MFATITERFPAGTDKVARVKVQTDHGVRMCTVVARRDDRHTVEAAIHALTGNRSTATVEGVNGAGRTVYRVTE